MKEILHDKNKCPKKGFVEGIAIMPKTTTKNAASTKASHRSETERKPEESKKPYENLRMIITTTTPVMVVIIETNNEEEIVTEESCTLFSIPVDVFNDKLIPRGRWN